MAYSNNNQNQNENYNSNYFKRLNDIDVKDFIEWKEYTAKNGKHFKLAFLSWAKAWEQAKLIYPDAQYTIYENNVNGLTLNYFHDGRTAYVKCGVMIKGIEHIEYLPVMDKSSKASLPLEQITSFDVNTSIQRCLTKALARHGMGLSVYIGDDLDNDDDTTKSYGYATNQRKKMFADKDGVVAKEPQDAVIVNKPQENKIKYSAKEIANAPLSDDDPFNTAKAELYTKDSIFAIVDKFPQSKQGTILHWVETRYQKPLSQLTPSEYKEAYQILEKRLDEIKKGGE